MHFARPPRRLHYVLSSRKLHPCSRDLLGSVLLGNVGDEVADTARVAVLVVVPRDELDKVGVEGDTGLGVKDGGLGGAKEVGGDDLVVSVAEDALELLGLGGLLDDVLDLVVRSTLLEADDKVDNGDVRGGDTEGHAGELAVERRDDLADGLGGTGGGGDDVGGSATATTPVLVGGTVDGLLGGSGSVDGGHETLNDAKVVVDDLGKGSETVGGARGVGDDLVLGLVSLEVDTADKHGGVGRRSRDDDLLGTTLEVERGLLNGGEDTGGLDDVVGARLAPWDGSGVTLTVDGDGLAVDDELAVLGLNGALEAAVGRVVLEHVNHVVKVDEGAGRRVRKKPS